MVFEKGTFQEVKMAPYTEARQYIVKKGQFFVKKWSTTPLRCYVFLHYFHYHYFTS